MLKSPIRGRSLEWVPRRRGWLGANLTSKVPPPEQKSEIEARARTTNQVGELPLAPEYGESRGTRSPQVVRCSPKEGDLYAWLVAQRQPKIVVEFGSAFGVSGMYLAVNLTGWLYSYEINTQWAAIAERNIAAFTERFTLTRGAFEDHVDDIPGSIDIAVVDGIHAYDLVMRQWEMLRPRISPGGFVLFDDINFRKPSARMREAWLQITEHPQVVAAVEVRRRLGVIELLGERD